MNKMLKKRLLLALFFWVALAGVTAAFDGGGGGTVVSRYAIRSLGLNIGTVSSKIAGTMPDNEFRADADVKVGLWYFSFSLKSSETASIRNGKLVRYHKAIDTGGHRREISGELVGDKFNISVSDRGKTERKIFPVAKFAATNMEYPEVTLAPGEVRRMRVIDLENAEIVDREYRHVSEEHQEVNGQLARVVIADFADKNSECRRWTAVVNGLPIVLRQDGKEKTGLFSPNYSVRQTKAAVRS